MKRFSFNGKKALVTGANSGIGQAISIALATVGAHVVCAGRRGCGETVDQITTAGGTAEDLKLDFADSMAAKLVFPDAGFDILVNNAGIIRRDDAVDFGEDDWDAVMDVNAKALFFTCQAFAREVMAQNRSGKIVNIASLLSFQGGIRVPSYTAWKHAVSGLTKLLAKEWAAKGVNVNAIAPGYVSTNNAETLRNDAERNKAILHRIPAGRWGEAQDIADTAVLLAAPASNYIHGAVLNVGGGWHAR
ncbi:2-dehydro-3-deoxy-D-gluconate 5-dehydrogenase KduD [Epibacterium ulvae]|uniref:2-dehydro-3-deoxy-D-gluconate 5-dehydrogenase KduD n=1 Tax=Epibacterium ulvae TaxID=1156985 RepID=UPI001BFC8694|nr:2-dehydro-3-deoxy-D-gluconate 5-dehydrogenase KduD [Epibacterium ulvae]MBT8155185.1 2-dehydro-3-deoxy-D-gluconate 5-dehydrogenase KduD [Epibacterium ulvae]